MHAKIDVRRDYRYDVAQRNCQGFAADLFSILTGKKVLPYALVCRSTYVEASHDFIEDPEL